MEEEQREVLRRKLDLFYTHLQDKDELKLKYQQMRNEEALNEEIKKTRWSTKKVESDYKPTVEEFDKLFGEM